MIGCLRTPVRKQPIIANYLSLRMNSSFITSRPGFLKERIAKLERKQPTIYIQSQDQTQFKPRTLCEQQQMGLSSGFANNRGANQPVYPHSLISTFVIRLLDIITFKLASSEISIF